MFSPTGESAMRLPGHFALVGLLLLQPLAAQDYTIEQILSSAFPTELTSTSGSGVVAWVQNREGVRNIWAARAPEYRGYRVTSFTEDDGQEITNLIVSPDGSQIVFVRGGAPNRQGEIPTPTSDSEWAKRQIWTVASVGGSEPTMLSEGASPTLSPNGDVIAYSRDGQIWTVPVDTADAKRLLTIRGSPGELQWSPNGEKLAFVSARGDHAFIGIFDFGSSSVTYMSPSVDRDGSPTWSPDGDRLAFIRTPNVRNALPFEPRRAGHPWSILVADAATGTTRTVWTARPGRGSVFKDAAYSTQQLFWGADDRLVFPWEGNGWTNLYSISTVGPADLQHLTPGPFEIEGITITADRREMVFSSNQDDIDRRHIWRVSVRGGPASRVTNGSGIEWAPVPLQRGTIAYLASGAQTPAHARIKSGDVDKELDPSWIPDNFPSQYLVEPEGVTLSGADGSPFHAQLFVPSDIRAGERRPALLFFHGGSRRQMLLGFHHRGYYHNAYALNQYFANRGYIVLSVNYRSGTGYGLEFREALQYGATGASEFNDVLGAGLYLRSRADVDANRIGLWGGSYGGYLTALGLARASDLFAAGVDIHGVHDWNVVVQGFRPDYDPNARAEWARLAFESSPMAHVERWRSPVLVIHGDDDRNVPFRETVDLVESLRRVGVETEQLIFPDEVHGFLLHKNWIAAYRATADFFERRLWKRSS